MSTINPAAESGVISKAGTMGHPKVRLGLRLLKYLFFGIASLISVLFVLHGIWKMSGSGQWELEIDKDGVQVYSLKMPGSTNVKFKGVAVYYNNTYSHMLASFNDESFTENCKELLPGCVKYRFLQSWNPKLMTNLQHWRIKLFPPFVDRELVLRGSITQDPKTKEVFLENIAVPNTIDSDDCCVRVRHMHNTWRYTPLEKGGVQVVYVQDFDLGGFFPDFLMSMGAPQVHQMLHTDIPKLMDNERYRKAKLDYIEEY